MIKNLDIVVKIEEALWYLSQVLNADIMMYRKTEDKIENAWSGGLNLGSAFRLFIARLSSRYFTVSFTIKAAVLEISM